MYTLVIIGVPGKPVPIIRLMMYSCVKRLGEPTVVCDDSCREIVLDPSNELLVCTVSGRCFDRWLTPAEEDDAEPGQQQADANAAAEEGEPFLGSGRLGQAYLLGYNCADEQELDEVVREVIYPSHKKSRFCYHG
jgi:hypothetical protein